MQSPGPGRCSLRYSGYRRSDSIQRFTLMTMKHRLFGRKLLAKRLSILHVYQTTGGDLQESAGPAGLTLKSIMIAALSMAVGGQTAPPAVSASASWKSGIWFLCSTSRILMAHVH